MVANEPVRAAKLFMKVVGVPAFGVFMMGVIPCQIPPPVPAELCSTPMDAPPPVIDGAAVLFWAADEEPLSWVHYTDGSHDPIAIHGVVIARYASGALYRFSCARDWTVQQDAPYASIEEAKRLPQGFDPARIHWIAQTQTS